LESVRPDARLVLIGDPDQLESVELGAVLADLVQVAVTAPSGPLAGRGQRLVRGHRYGGDTPIALLADAIRRGDPAEALDHLRSNAEVDGSSIHLHETDDPMRPAVIAAVEHVVSPSLLQLRSAAEAGDGAAALAAAAQVRVLCAHRSGPFGAADWNRLAERWMYGAAGAGSMWFAGRPLLATRNDARLGVANGDTGVVIRDQGRLVAVFQTGMGMRTFELVQLEGVETAYAMTIHKSQGSEYPTVVLVLPPANSPLVGRELVYTGATRAKNTLHVVGSVASLQASLATPAHRMTGLADALSSP
jgi:exodeoxyribonuclease V alpha subunit